MRYKSIKRTIYPPDPFKDNEKSKWYLYLRESLIELAKKTGNTYSKIETRK